MSQFFRQGPSKTVAAPLFEDVDESQELALGGYTSSDNFFNFKTKISQGTDTNKFLYAPRMMGVPSAR